MDFNLETFKEKAGPIPVWGWVVVIVGGGYLVYRRKQASSSADAANSTIAASADQSTPTEQDYQAALLAADYSQLNALGLNTSSINSETASNAVLNASLGSNTSAVNKNTSADIGNTGALTGNTGALKSNTVAISHIPKVATPPKKAPAPKGVTKPRQNVYTVKAGDNLSRIATQFKTSWQAIYAANKGIIGSNPNLIKPGQRLVIP